MVPASPQPRARRIARVRLARVRVATRLTQSCPIRRRRVHLPWCMRDRCRSTSPGTKVVPSLPTLERGYLRHTPAAGGACRGLAIAARETRTPQYESLPRSVSLVWRSRGKLSRSRTISTSTRHVSGRKRRIVSPQFPESSYARVVATCLEGLASWVHPPSVGWHDMAWGNAEGSLECDGCFGSPHEIGGAGWL